MKSQPCSGLHSFISYPPKGTQNRELKSGMTKPKEFDSSILLLAKLLVIWADCGGSLVGGWGGGGAGVGVGREVESGLVLGRKEPRGWPAQCSLS